MTQKIVDFLRTRREIGNDAGPCLVVDLDVVRENYRLFEKASARQPRLLRGEGQPPIRRC